MILTSLPAFGGTARFAGYAALFGRPDLTGDVVLPGAFARSLALQGARGVRLLWQHDPREPVGVWDDIHEDDKGLRVTGRLYTGVTRGREALVLVRGGALDGLSIGYRVRRASTLHRRGAGRRLMELDLIEISLVTFPMQTEARIGAIDTDAPVSAGGNQSMSAFAHSVRRAAHLMAAGIPDPDGYATHKHSH